MKDHFSASNLRYWRDKLFQTQFGLMLLIASSLLVAVFVFFLEARPWNVGTYVVSGEVISVEVIRFHPANAYRRARFPKWDAIGKTEDGEMWPLVWYRTLPYEVGSTIEVELRCSGAEIKYCKGVDGPHLNLTD